ncbi:MAG: (d)CMP kinase [Ureaplasma sp.]|nr:(d)CMP kinase [Ureaplasma sp.]
MENKYFSITIDGPAGSGKSTLANLFAQKFDGFTYVNTGSMFRAIAYYLKQNNIDYNNEIDVENNLNKINIELENDNVYLIQNNNKEDISNYIREPEISKISSQIAQYSCVREKLLNIQREIANKQNVIMDGRDIGTKVLPNANIKIFLVADISQRAIRRQKQLLEQNIHVDLESIENEIKQRDENDANRKNAPLIKPNDAFVIDTTNITIEDTLNQIINLFVNYKK